MYLQYFMVLWPQVCDLSSVMVKGQGVIEWEDHTHAPMYLRQAGVSDLLTVVQGVCTLCRIMKDLGLGGGGWCMYCCTMIVLQYCGLIVCSECVRCSRESGVTHREGEGGMVKWSSNGRGKGRDVVVPYIVFFVCFSNISPSLVCQHVFFLLACACAHDTHPKSEIWAFGNGSPWTRVGLFVRPTCFRSVSQNVLFFSTVQQFCFHLFFIVRVLCYNYKCLILVYL